MDVVEALTGYVNKIVTSVEGMKVLLLDEETKTILSSLFTLSFLLEHDIFLMEKLDNVGREELKCLKCLVLVRPTSANMELLVEELRAPKYSQYHIYFTNFLKNAYLERLAEADEQQLVQAVTEVYGDYYALDKNHFSIGLRLPVVGDQINSWAPKALQRTREGLVAVLLALRRFPGVIRYDGASLMATRLANEVKEALKKDVVGFFDGGGASGSSSKKQPVLLIVDRKSDLITPLLLQWTYQALLHDLFGINNGFVDTTGYLYGSKESSELLSTGKKNEHRHVFVPGQDEFYADNLHQNFGKVSDSLQGMLKAYQERRKEMASLESLAGMKRFLEDYPKLTKMQGVMSKHVMVGQVIQSKVNEDQLLMISEAEQGIVCDQPNVRVLEEILADAGVKRPFKFKLALLFAIQSSKFPFNKSFNLLAFFDLLRRQGFSDDDIGLLDFALKYGQGDRQRQTGGSGRNDLNALALNTITREDQNVYTQHVPPIVSLVDALTKGKLPLDSYPLLSINGEGSGANEVAREIVVFVVGGSTYEEACHLDRYCRHLGNGVGVVLGGTTVHNSTSLINEMVAVKKHLTPSAGGLVNR